MPFNVCYYHFIWTTKQRAPLLAPEIERLVYNTIDDVSKTLVSPILAMNGLEDHIHIAVRLALKVSISDWAQRVKGASARAVNSQYPDLEQRFRWQEGYGVLTFGAKNVEFVVGYIHQQKDRHRMNNIEAYLETTDDDNE
jgi:REP element-mobilizing transposase RayT